MNRLHDTEDNVGVDIHTKTGVVRMLIDRIVQPPSVQSNEDAIDRFAWKSTQLAGNKCKWTRRKCEYDAENNEVRQVR